MAYNYYQPMGYQPQNPYQQYAPAQTMQQTAQSLQSMQQPIQQIQQPMPQIQQPMQFPQAQTPNGIIWVNDYNEAAMYPVAMNSAVALWDKSAPTIYLKKSDMTGKPTMTVYDLIERKEPVNPTPESQGVVYATKTDLQDVLATVDDLKNQLNEMRHRTQSKPIKEGVENDE